MTDEMKEKLHEAIMECFFVEGNVGFDEGMFEHVADLMCDAAEAVFDMASKMHGFLMNGAGSSAREE